MKLFTIGQFTMRWCQCFQILKTSFLRGASATPSLKAGGRSTMFSGTLKQAKIRYYFYYKSIDCFFYVTPLFHITVVTQISIEIAIIQLCTFFVVLPGRNFLFLSYIIYTVFFKVPWNTDWEPLHQILPDVFHWGKNINTFVFEAKPSFGSRYLTFGSGINLFDIQ